MVVVLQKKLYTAETTVKGGRSGHGTSADGILDLDIQPPVEMGGSGLGTNPEELFALGFSACFQSAMGVAGRRLHVDTSESTVTARVSIGPIEGGAYGLAVELEINIPDTDRETAEKIADAAHQICPYSNATRGNIEVVLTIV
jgi:osmotically inducible protein OsmC